MDKRLAGDDDALREGSIDAPAGRRGLRRPLGPALLRGADGAWRVALRWGGARN